MLEMNISKYTSFSNFLEMQMEVLGLIIVQRLVIKVRLENIVTNVSSFFIFYLL